MWLQQNIQANKRKQKHVSTENSGTRRKRRVIREAIWIVAALKEETEV